MNEERPRLSLLITTRNRREHLLRTLEVMAPALPPGTEILVLDDGSTDGTSEAVAARFPGVTRIRHSAGKGYIAARNLLLSLAQGELALSLDDDAEVVDPSSLITVEEHFAAHPRCAVAALRVFWGRSLPPGALDCREAPRPVRSFVGCGHVWRMEAWRSLPPYPEWFQAYGEEAFASFELLRRGWEVHYLPSVLVHHRVVPRERPAAERVWRYRRQLRAGLYLACLFHPTRELPRRLAYSFWDQLRRRAWREPRVLLDLMWVAKELGLGAPRLLRSRSPLDELAWRTWRTLPPEVVYWTPTEVPCTSPS
jgi:GT2 family glycosyltransferase